MFNNVKQALRVIQEYTPLLEAFKASTGVTSADIESWNGSELAYLEALQSEPEQVGLTMDYVSFLSDLWEAE